MDSKFQVASGAVDFDFGVDPKLSNYSSVCVSHVIVNFDTAPTSAGEVVLSLVVGEDTFVLKSESVESKTVVLFEFATPLLISVDQLLKISYANPDDRAVSGLVVHSYKGC